MAEINGVIRSPRILTGMILQVPPKLNGSELQKHAMETTSVDGYKPWGSLG